MDEKYIKLYTDYRESLDLLGILKKSGSRSERSKSNSDTEVLYDKLIDGFKGFNFLESNPNDLTKIGFEWKNENHISIPLWVFLVLSEDVEIFNKNGDSIKFQRSFLNSISTNPFKNDYGFTRSQFRDSRINKIFNG